MGHFIEERFNSSRSDLDGTTRPCPCGGTATYKGCRAKTFQTTLGPLALQRTYDHCAACNQGCYPRDDALGLRGRTVSPGLERMIDTGVPLRAAETAGRAGCCIPQSFVVPVAHWADAMLPQERKNPEQAMISIDAVRPAWTAI